MTRWFWMSLALTVASLGAAVFFALLRPDLLQESVPVHWNAQMEPDQYLPRDQARFTFFLFPAIMALMVGLTWGLPILSPQKFEIDPFRAVFEYAMLLVVVLFAVIGTSTVWAAITGVMPEKLFVGSFFVFWALIGNVIGKVQRNWWLGVRTPWTLASEAVWIRTHRLAAWLWTGVGVVGFVAVLAGVPFMIAFAAFMASAIYPVFYSLWLYKRLQRAGKLEA